MGVVCVSNRPRRRARSVIEDRGSSRRKQPLDISLMPPSKRPTTIGGKGRQSMLVPCAPLDEFYKSA
jgi:hypothetical protein